MTSYQRASAHISGSCRTRCPLCHPHKPKQFFSRNSTSPPCPKCLSGSISRHPWGQHLLHRYRTGSKYWSFLPELLDLLEMIFRSLGTRPNFSGVQYLKPVRYFACSQSRVRFTFTIRCVIERSTVPTLNIDSLFLIFWVWWGLCSGM